MFALIKDNVVLRYPYTMSDLKKDNPNVSFSTNINLDNLQTFGMYAVHLNPAPAISTNQILEEATPIFNVELDKWEQVWVVRDLTEQEIAEVNAQKVEIAKQQRLEAYRNEADPLFFKSQRGETTQQEWLDKVAEIKQRFPK